MTLLLLDSSRGEEADHAKVYINAADTQDTINFGIVTDKDIAEGSWGFSW